MTLAQNQSVLTWSEPAALSVRGTLVVLPGRGESPEIYERFGARLAADAYRVHAVTAPSDDPATVDLIARVLADADPSTPRVLVGSDAGALAAADLVARQQIEGVTGLVLAGLPVARAVPVEIDWPAEVEARTACTTHQARISRAGVRPGALSIEPPAQWYDPETPARLRVPVLGLHGADDPVSPAAEARRWFARVPTAEYVTIAGGRHDVLNDLTHRTVAATVVQFLERLRLGAHLPAIAVRETLAARP